jgi:glycerol-3-phosphate dehydrogenase
MALLERPDVCVIGGGVVGAAVTLALARRGVDVLMLEAEAELALGASGTNSGILHSGFDSTPGELETRLIRRSGELRDEVLSRLGVPVLRCGAEVRPAPAQRGGLEGLVERARRNGVEVERRDQCLAVPGEAVTDPVRLTVALADAAARLGARIVCSAPVERVACGEHIALGGPDGEIVRARSVVNCAGLFADEVARAAGNGSFRIFPRKGEFVVFAPPRDGAMIDRILLPVPSERTKGVLVFPTVDGHVIAGPTARDQQDKRDWTVSPAAARELVDEARRIAPVLESHEHVFSYAGLRPAGADGVNYLIEPARSCPRLIHVAAIRSTGLSACLGIAEHVAALVEETGLPLGHEQALPGVEPVRLGTPWWRRAADYWSARR